MFICICDLVVPTVKPQAVALYRYRAVFLHALPSAIKYQLIVMLLFITRAQPVVASSINTILSHNNRFIKYDLIDNIINTVLL